MKKALSLISVLVIAAGALVSCGSKKSSSSDKEATRSEDKVEQGIIGTWLPSGDTLKAMMDDLGSGMTMEKAEIVFDEKNMTMNASVDASDIIYVTADGVNLSGENFDREYDGEVLSVVIEGQEVASFERMGAPDKENIYGKYTNDEMGFVEGGEIYFEFVEEGVSYMVISQSSEYTYDEEAGTVTVVDADGEEEVSSVKIDGNNMTVEDQEGKIETFTRAD